MLEFRHSVIVLTKVTRLAVEPKQELKRFQTSLKLAVLTFLKHLPAELESRGRQIGCPSGTIHRLSVASQTQSDPHE
jgi:hypothetical protein